MIEAVNASISNAQALRQVAEDATRSTASNPVRAQKASVTAPYLSPHVRLAPNTKPIFVVRDLETGAQIKQFPTEAQIRAYQKAGEAREQMQAEGQSSEQKTITPEQARLMIKSSVEYKEERAAVRYKQEVAIPGGSGGGESAGEFKPAAVDQEA
jgi:hypothetical protein